MAHNPPYAQRGWTSPATAATKDRAADLRARLLAALCDAGAAGMLSEALHDAVKTWHVSIRRRTKMLATLRDAGLVTASERAVTGHGLHYRITDAGRAEHAANTTRRAA